MLHREHSAILSTFIKLPFVIKNFVLSIFSGRFAQVLLYSQYVYTSLHMTKPISHLGMSVTTQGGSGRQYVTGP